MTTTKTTTMTTLKKIQDEYFTLATRVEEPLVRFTGEMADSMLLSGQRATPGKAQQLGFKFAYPTLALALDTILHHE